MLSSTLLPILEIWWCFSYCVPFCPIHFLSVLYISVFFLKEKKKNQSWCSKITFLVYWFNQKDVENLMFVSLCYWTTYLFPDFSLCKLCRLLVLTFLLLLLSIRFSLCFYLPKIVVPLFGCILNGHIFIFKFTSAMFVSSLFCKMTLLG